MKIRFLLLALMVLSPVSFAYANEVSSPSAHADIQKSLSEATKHLLENGPIYCDDYSVTSPDLLTRAEEGDAYAQSEIGRRYLSGNGVPKNHTEAKKWLERAANQGNALAQLALVDVYASGHDEKQDFEQAYFWKLLGKDWYAGNMPQKPENHLSDGQKKVIENKASVWKPTLTANTHTYDPIDTDLSVPCQGEFLGLNASIPASQGNPYAQIALGKFLKAKKNWRPRNYGEAYFWFSLAAQKVDLAKQERDDAGGHLSSDQKAYQDKRVKDWKPTSGHAKP